MPAQDCKGACDTPAKPAIKGVASRQQQEQKPRVQTRGFAFKSLKAYGVMISGVAVNY